MAHSAGIDDRAAKGRITSSHRIRIDHFPVPPALSPFVVTLYHFTCDETRLSDMIPAGVGYVMVLLTGRASLRFTAQGPGDAPGFAAPELALLTPTSAAARVEADGPLHLIGAALSPLGWSALTGLDAYAVRDRVMPADPWLGADPAARLARWRAAYAAGEVTGADLCVELAGLLGAGMALPPPRHLALLRETADWLSSSLAPPTADLGRRSGYSVRQVERLVKRYFGATPRELVRKYRALRVAALLQAPDCSDEQAAGLIDLFYDQSHLIREMRHFLGRTPARLAGEESALTSAVNGIDNYRDRQPSFARLPKG